MYTMEFVNWDDPAGNNVLHSVEWYDKDSFSLDPRAISGVDFHSLEARLLKFETSQSEWIKSNLMAHVGANVIGRIKYYLYAIKVFDNGVEEGVFYIRKDGVNPDEASGLIEITARDITGLLMDYEGEFIFVGDATDNHYDRLLDLIRRSLTTMGGGGDIQNNPFNISIDTLYDPLASGIGYPLDFQELYNIPWDDWVLNENQLPIWARGKVSLVRSFYFVKEIDNELQFGALRYYHGIEQESAISPFRRYEYLIYNYGKVTNTIDISEIEEYSNEQITNSLELSQAEKYGLYIQEWTDKGRPEGANYFLQYFDDQYFMEYEEGNAVLRVTGTQELTTLVFEPGIYSYWALIKGLLFMNNLAIIAEANGNVSIRQKSTAITEQGSQIKREVFHDVDPSKIIIPSVDYNSILGFLKNKSVWTPAIQAYYDDVLVDLEDELTCEVETSVELNFMRPFFAFGKPWVVVSLGKDSTGDFYQVKAWNQL